MRLVPWVLCLFVACGESDAAGPVDVSSDVDTAPSGVDTSEDGDPSDASSDTTGPDTSVEARACPGGTLFERPFVTSVEPARPGSLAADFDIETLTGRYALASRWTGCESHIVFVHFPGITDSLWRSESTVLFSEGPANAQYIFVSDSADAEARIDDLVRVERSIEAGLLVAVRDDAARQAWRDRIHYATGRARELDGGIGDYVRSELAFGLTPESIVDLGDRGTVGLPAPVVFGITPDQRFDPGDNLSPSVGQSETLGMAAFLGHFYNWRVALEHELARASGHVVSIIDERTTRRIIDSTSSLPDNLMVEHLDSRGNVVAPSVKANRATLEVAIDCEARNPFACSEWDRIANISVCTDATCAARSELVRWITPYWRRGLQRYRLDFSHLIGLLNGGETTFRVELGPDWERPTEWRLEVDLRLEHVDPNPGVPPNAPPPATTPAGAWPAFASQGFGADYGGEGMMFTVPAEATRVELAVLVSGHGQTAGDNCAEWCDHRHVFAVDGVEIPPILHQGAAIGEPRGCANLSKQGVISGQWGNWAQQRAFWCPGLEVSWQRRDLTALVTPGDEHILTLEGFLGADGAPAGGDIALTTYLIWY